MTFLLLYASAVITGSVLAYMLKDGPHLLVKLTGTTHITCSHDSQAAMAALADLIYFCERMSIVAFPQASRMSGFLTCLKPVIARCSQHRCHDPMRLVAGTGQQICTATEQEERYPGQDEWQVLWAQIPEQ